MAQDSENNIEPAEVEETLSLQEATTEEVDINALRSLLRLLVGGSEIGVEELRRRLQIWEQQVGGEMQEQADADIIELDMEGDERIYRKSSSELREEFTAGTIRFALIGLLFETQEGLRSGVDTADRLSRAISRIAQPWLRPFQKSRMLAPFRSRYDSLAARGEEALTRWIRRGRAEALHGRALAQSAFTETVNNTLEYLSENPEVRELVQSQSTGLADEMLEEARERTVSADTYLEGVVRSLLKRRPRRELPEPSEDVKKQALTYREQREKWVEEQ